MAKSLYEVLCQFESELLESNFISKIVESNYFIPPGFNQNCTELVKIKSVKNKKQLDISALIACALNSNLYLSGLAYLDYLNLPANIKPFNGQFIAREGRSWTDNEIIMAAADKFSVGESSQRV